LDYPVFEIIILPDSDMGTHPLKANTVTGQLPSELSYSAQQETVPFRKGTVPIKIIPTGPISPAGKRDAALNYANGEILAFIDDDAYPQKSWLTNALKNFQDPEVAAVGGPAVTPGEDSLRQKASGLVYSSGLVSAKFAYRYLPKNRIEVDDYPACNFFVRKSIMLDLGGFKTNFWPGEDTKLCLEITKSLGKKIIYDSTVLVYHHRRPLFTPHLRQIASYALHRGYFVKRYPATSLKISYFIPTLFLLGIIIGALLSLFFPSFRIIYFLALFLYLLLVFIFGILGALPLRGLSLKTSIIPLVSCGIILTHLVYGFYFLKGLLSRRLKEEGQV